MLHTMSCTVLALLVLTCTSVAQKALFAYPQDGDTLVAGSNISIRVDRPTPSGPVVEAGIGLGMSPCNESCPSPETSFEYLFYAGAFNPQRPAQVSLGEDFSAFQNFTVTVPSIDGPAILGFLHSSFGEGAAAFYPYFESVNITVNVVPSSQ
ncbi:uncharacterized protein C8R40DRAFT_784456 [Lentinula edodes]|uniref:uncharacterized protein n=1 Tax=Lentinula edodes TaxID=5353 RepID=UPI001E8E6CCD|nr:uncharacterized protein C8R40DRAFT_784456 [Lentinula edodes]KAH7878721.1 hypothetical protein C8R40DRAFT_784456 [Lentinula edodes]